LVRAFSSDKQITAAIRKSVLFRESNMKLQLTSALVFASLVGAVSAHADDALAGIGQTPASACFKAAAMVSRTGTALPGALRKDALVNCEQALGEKLTPKDRIATLVNRGTIESASGDIGASLADYDAALTINPNTADIYINRGSALLRAARYEEARNDFDKALALGPTNAYVAYFDRGMAQEKSGNITAAYADYKQAAALAPDYKPAKAVLARFQTARPSDHG
jgi:tetratricopeptide (TPR) repeat protein